MKKLTWSFPAKVAAVFLWVVSALTAAAFTAVAVSGYVFGLYSVPASVITYQEALEHLEGNGYLSKYDYHEMAVEHREYFEYVFSARMSSIVIAVISALAFLLLFVFLMCAAGRRGGREGVYLSFFDKIPYDIVFVAAAVLETVLFSLELECVYAWGNDDIVIMLLLMAGVAIPMLLIVLLAFYTFAARVKAGSWWRNTLVFIVCALIFRWIRGFWRYTVRLFRALRLEWRVALAVVGFAFINIFIITLVDNHMEEMGLLIFLAIYAAAFCVMVFSASQFRKLRSAGEKLAAGELDFKVDLSRMYFDFRRHGEDLNSIAEGMSAAVEQRMRSERLKTELITNVSHDIKTPLTSIVNYVDLLQKEHTPEQESQYLDVLKRQSDKLRRLTVDLVEASKASTGNLPTELAPTSTEELINQAVAEYADKFEAGGLEPVVTCPDKPVTVLADGRHLWRVLDNLFNNAVKYAQPGTRVYVDVRRMDGGAVISVKNISRDRLNLSSEELMERFVRGDQSRHTEGSGLGLSIARSLTELMGGSFDIVIDGDLFKAEIRLKLL